MKRLWLAVLTLGWQTLPAQSQKPDEIIARFAEKETEFREVWAKYTYKQRVQFEILDWSGAVRERQVVEIEVYFTNDGKRHTRVLQDRGRLKSLEVTAEDFQDAVGIQPFVLTSAELPQYEIRYQGPERVDELDTHVFEVKPKKIQKGQRYFRGKIWVDAVDLQIVMSRGKAVPDIGNNKFPRFETRREQIDGQYWFPTWTEADDILSFGSFEDRHDVHVRQLITYYDFKKFEVGTAVRYGKPHE
jgi:hypothetical protein